MAVGSVGSYLKAYDECDTFLSQNAGVSWTMIKEGARKYEVGDSGGVIVVVDDEEAVDHVEFSTDFGTTWYVWFYFLSLRYSSSALLINV